MRPDNTPRDFFTQVFLAQHAEEAVVYFKSFPTKVGAGRPSKHIQSNSPRAARANGPEHSRASTVLSRHARQYARSHRTQHRLANDGKLVRVMMFHRHETARVRRACKFLRLRANLVKDGRRSIFPHRQRK